MLLPSTKQPTIWARFSVLKRFIVTIMLEMPDGKTGTRADHGLIGFPFPRSATFGDMDSGSFVIDINSPQNLVAKHREAVMILEAKQQELASLRDLERQVTKWRAVVDFLASQLPDIEPGQSAARNGHAPNNESKPDIRGASIGDLAVEVVNREVRKIRAKEVRAILNAEGHDFSAEQVSNALHYAAHSSKRIQAAPGRGMYAPLAYHESEPPDPTNDATGPTLAHRPEGEAASTLERLPGPSNGSPTAVRQVSPPPPYAPAGREAVG